jgi:hypothetical protein
MSHLQIDIPPENPFQNDILSRKEYIEKLTQLLSSLDEPTVFSIDAPWGTGKTTFIKMWRQYLLNANFNCIYFNAWETDFSDDPLVSIVGELSNSLAELKVKDKGVDQKIVKIKESAIQIAKKSVPLIVSLATSGIIKLDADTEKQISAFTAAIAKEKIENYDKQKAGIEKFRTNLLDFVSDIKNKTEQHSPFIIFIDELDRCRPTYSVELLECAKHLFNVPGIIFILSIDKPQLVASVNALYGNNFDSQGYLKRFIDFDFLLPEVKDNSFCNHLFDRLGINDFFNQKRTGRSSREEGEQIYKITSVLLQLMKFSLRDQIQHISRLSIILKTIPDGKMAYGEELALLLLIRSWKPDLYKQFVQVEIDPKVIISELRKLPNSESFFTKNISAIVESFLIASGLSINVDGGLLEEYKLAIKDENSKKEIKDRAERITEFVRILWQGFEGKVNLRTTSARIEFSDKFRVKY